MCGIYGELGASTASVQMREMSVDTMSHRGPDDRGTWHGEGVYLGMRRLSILDIAGGGQPIWNESNTCCVVFNGEIYNFRELRERLEAKGHRFRTSGDTEVIVHAYEQWGVDFLKQLNGMFAIALWDNENKRLLLARDRIGEKPLYYYYYRGRLVFASEIKAILSTGGVPKCLNTRGLVNFLTFGHSSAPDTMYECIHKLLPGHYLLATESQINIREYWDIGQKTGANSMHSAAIEEYCAEILGLLDDSVKHRMIADVPVGAFLSGGVDSSAIVALMTRHASLPVKTFALGFSVGGAYNELSEARAVADYLGTEHHELDVRHYDLVNTVRKLVYHYDEPFGDAAGFPLYLLSQFAREHVKVVLSGDGGDELFGGYRRYSADRIAALYQWLPEPLTRNLLPSFFGALPRLRRIKQSLRALPIRDPLHRYAAWLEVFTPEMLAELMHAGSDDTGYDPLRGLVRYFDRGDTRYAGNPLTKMMYVDAKTLLSDGYMEKADKATMACSLEARLPLLDHRLVELAFSMPDHLKIRGMSTKWLFKKAVHPLLPPSVTRRRKHGFAVPIDPWFRGKLKSFAYEVLLDDTARGRGYFNSSFVERLWAEHESGRHNWNSHLWLLLNFELWHRIYLDGEGI